MTPRGNHHRLLRLAAALALLPAAACTQQMANQPSYYPLKPSSFFPDGRSARPLLPGTIARERLRDNDLLFTGRAAPLQHNAASGMAQGMMAVDVADWQKWSAEFPFEPTAENIKRGKQRYGIYCSMCHGPTGHGYGKIIERGFTRPPSYHVEKDGKGQVDKDRSLSRGYRHRGIEMPLRDAPVGYYYDVISNGYGAMGHYREQVSPADRWKIIAYIRTLQYSEAPEADRAAILKGGNP